MKNSIVLFILIGIGLSACAQPVFGIFGGPQSTSVKYMVSGNKQDASSKVGFHLGAGVKIPFDNNLYFAPVAFYSLKGYKVKFSQRAFPPDTLAVDNNTTINTFELGFLLQYDLGKQAHHFFIKAGPSLDFQLTGKEKFHLTNGNLVDQSMKFSFGDYGHFAANLLFQFGFETGNGFVIAGQYTNGLADINNADYGPYIVHRAFGLVIGKYFTRKKTIIDTRNKE